MSLLLATVEPVSIGLAILGLVAQAMVALWIRSIDQRTRKMESLEGELKETAKTLVSAEISLQTKSLQSSIDGLTLQMQAMREQVKDGEGEVAKLGERGNSFALALKDQTSELQKWMMEKFATKNDVHLVSDQLSSLGDRVGQIALAQAKSEGVAEGLAHKRSSKTV